MPLIPMPNGDPIAQAADKAYHILRGYCVFREKKTIGFIRGEYAK